MTDTAADLRQIAVELNDVIIEKADAIDLAILAMLARVHVFFIGPPGTGKSLLLEQLCKRIDGGSYGRFLLDRQADKSELFGQYDVARYARDGVWERDIVETVGDHHLLLLDELWSGGPSSLLPMVTLLEERKVKPGKTWVQTPLLAAFGASNEMPDDSVAKVADRFTARIEVDYIEEPSNFMRLLGTPIVQVGEVEPRPAPATITLDALLEATVAVQTVEMSREIAQTLMQLRSDLRAEQIRPSDRRWPNAVKLLQASAWLEGRDFITSDDLLVLVHVLWDKLEDKAKVQAKVLALVSASVRARLQLAEVVTEIASALDKLNANEESLETRAAEGSRLQHRLNEIKDKLLDAIGDARRTNRGLPQLLTVARRLGDVQERLLIECLAVDATTAADRARRSLPV